MSKEKPKIHPSEFRESSVKLAIESDQPIAQTARVEIGDKKGIPMDRLCPL